MKVHIRWMIRRDMDEVRAIDNGSYDPAWADEDFTHQLRQRNIIGMVAEVGEKVVGFMVYELHPRKLVLARLAVDPALRKYGIGRQMLEKLIHKLSSHRRKFLVIDVCEDNLSAHLFLKACGMEATRVDRAKSADDVTTYHFVYKTSEEIVAPEPVPF